MSILTGLIRLDREFAQSITVLDEQLRAPTPLPMVINGLCAGASRAYLTEALLTGCSKLSLVITRDDVERDKLCDFLSKAGLRVLAYKPRDLIFYNISASHDSERERLLVLSSVLRGEVDVVVSTARAACSFTVPRERLLKMSVSYRVGDTLSPIELCERLTDMGFVSVSLVEAAGQFSKRGGIVDFYPSEGENPIRVEFFGDEIDRCVHFDPLTQRALDSISGFNVMPALEVTIDKIAKGRVTSEINRLLINCKLDAMCTSLRSELAVLEGGGVLLTRDKYLGLIYPEGECLISYMLSVCRPAVFILGSQECEEELKRAISDTSEQIKLLESHGLVNPKYCEHYLSLNEYKSMLARCAVVNINPFAGVSSAGALSGLFGFRSKRTVGYGDNNNSLLLEDLRSLCRGGYKIVIMSQNKAGVKSLVSTLTDEGFLAISMPNVDEIDIRTLNVGSITVTVGGGEGYELITPRAALLSTERDEGARIMSERRSRRILKRVGGSRERIMSHNDLSVGDYVVHANYGIGIFEGIQAVRALGVTRDYITIRYAGTDKLFIPCDKLDMISKYIGQRAENGTVKLSKMGGADWHKTKMRAKGAVKDIAKKLIQLYAQREQSEGIAFPADSEMEDEFASGFEYEETESQSQAIKEIKQDMMRPRPMNRLLLGDVGFGKTEVALRAAFKAIMGGRQVAILVPTTILAMQHYQTALSRMRGYAVNVEMLSRFRTAREQSRIMADVERGKVDILIGTHKLLNKNLKFRRLGLLIVDEEQRFGVSQKEKLKEMAVGVDVLTLSATPIPRTLNMAMNGISDMSVLDEPPGNRRPVQTYVMEHDEPVIIDAVKRELYRGGQVLYLYNNVEKIAFVASHISEEIPEARVAYAHGQMEHEELEDIWQMLIRGEIDVLVCTTIIETGVDLPNANTLIIENSDRMGLSQLHQIRGRVGRSERQAYAYFTYRPGKALSEIATKRLSAIREYAEFGAGFKVALRDMEIRGAGNLLGSEQHGYIESVGYDLYVKLLAQAVAEERGESTADESFEAIVDIKVDANIPERYIASAANRMEMYKRISDIRNPADKEDVYDELSDRFGDVPRATERLLSVALCRAIMEAARISRVTLDNAGIHFYMQKPALDIWGSVMSKHRGKLYGNSSEAPIVLRISAKEDAISALEEVLSDYYDAMSNMTDSK